MMSLLMLFSGGLTAPTGTDGSEFYLPAKATLSAWKGATYRQRFYLFDEYDRTRDLTGYSAVLTIKTSTGTTLVTLTGTTNGGGAIDIIWPGSATGAVTWQSAVFELALTSPNGDPEIPVWGVFRIKTSTT